VSKFILNASLREQAEWGLAAFRIGSDAWTGDEAGDMVDVFHKRVLGLAVWAVARVDWAEEVDAACKASFFTPSSVLSTPDNSCS